MQHIQFDLFIRFGSFELRLRYDTKGRAQRPAQQLSLPFQELQK